MDFRAIVDEVLAGYFRAYPVQATEIGHHAYDGVWPDLTDSRPGSAPGLDHRCIGAGGGGRARRAEP